MRSLHSSPAMTFFVSSNSRKAERPVLIDEHVLFLLVQGAEQLADGLAVRLTASSKIEIRSSRCSSNEKLSSVDLLIGVVVFPQRAREHQQLLVATDAILVVVPIGSATDLAIHSSSLSSALSSGW